MVNIPAAMCKLDRVNIFSSITNICDNLFGACTAFQQDRLRDDINRTHIQGHNYLLLLLEPSSAAVINEIEIYINGSDAQRQIKRLLNKKLPVILAVSFFDDYDYPQGDVCVVGYSRLLDRMSAMTSTGYLSREKLMKYIKSRRVAWRQVFKAVTLDSFLDELRKELEN